MFSLQMTNYKKLQLQKTFWDWPSTLPQQAPTTQATMAAM